MRKEIKSHETGGLAPTLQISLWSLTEKDWEKKNQSNGDGAGHALLTRRFAG